MLDHCHHTGAPRAMLCNGCNSSLGMLKEDPMRIMALARYASWCKMLRFNLFEYELDLIALFEQFKKDGVTFKDYIKAAIPKAGISLNAIQQTLRSNGCSFERQCFMDELDEMEANGEIRRDRVGRTTTVHLRA